MLGALFFEQQHGVVEEVEAIEAYCMLSIAGQVVSSTVST